jgi:predicted DNA-binding transcriptional regulator AlpA
MTLHSSHNALTEDASQPERVSAHSPHRKLSVKEAAAYLGLSASTLNKTRLNGNGPPYLKLGRRVVYDLHDVNAWACQRRRSNTSEPAADGPIL